MNSKTMLFECIECKETYLADNLCDGYNCPKCEGIIVGRGFIKDIEEGLKDMQDKINKAKENGLIRKYTKPPRTNYIPFDGHIATLPFDKCKHGVDLGSGKDSTVFTIHADIDELTKIDDVLKMFNDLKKSRRVGTIR
ncbi:hypothetical protein KQI41_01155 [Tissierella pigra]|uniref:hypothetical protein n=1 Tax=Tissierella pigra TaxID=2607614 RepID=UPI001C1111C6|nr:hypothetical protein [Tissierella pigra]MBU5425003.1 hypothetical protein [Tissierella pigra]